MAEQRDENNELKSFEAVLASLTPRGDRLSRDRLMFLAGQASMSADDAGVPLLACKQCGSPKNTASGEAVAHPQPGRWMQPGWAWPAAFAASTTAAAALLVLLWQQPAPQVVERVVEKTVYVPAPATTVVRDAGDSPAAAAAPRGVAGGFSSRRNRFDQPTPGWWTVLTGVPESTPGFASQEADSTYAALYAQLREGPAGLELRNLSGGRAYRMPMAAASEADAGPTHPTSQIELREELLGGGRSKSPPRPKSYNPKGERS